MSQHYFNAFIRSLKRNPLMNMVNILGLALALSLAIASVIFISNEINFDTHHSKADRIYRMTYRFNRTDYDIHWARMNQPWVNEFPDEFSEAEKLVRFQSFRPRNIKVGEKKFREEFAFAVDDEVFAVFDFEFVSGYPTEALTQPNSIVLTESTAEKYFGSENAMGKTVTILDQNNVRDYKVTAVVKDQPEQTHLPITFLSSINSEEERTGWAYTYILLKENSSIEYLESKISDFLKQREPENSEFLTLDFQPIKDIHLHSDLSREVSSNGNYDYVILFFVITILLILIAGINFANLNTVKSISQSKNWGIRQLIGAKNAHLKKSILIEAFFLTFISIVLASAVVLVFFGKLESLIGYSLEIFWTEIICFIVLSLIVLTLLSGFYPVQLISRLKPVTAISGKLGGQLSGSNVRNILLTLQFIIVLILLSATILVNRQFHFISNRNLGFEKENLLAIRNYHYPLDESYETFKNKLKNIQGVQDITALMELPTIAVKDEGQVQVKGLPSEKTITADIQVIDVNAIDVLGFEMVAGNALDESLKSIEPLPKQDYMEFLQTRKRAYLLNESAMKLLGWSEPSEALNQEINWAIGDLSLAYGPIVGILKDFHQEGLKASIDPVIFTYEQIWLQNVIIKTSANDFYSTRQEIENSWNKLYPEYPFQLSFMDDEVERTYQSEKKQRTLMGIFTTSAVIITFLGLFSLVSLVTEKRLKELAIHKILGASIMNMVFVLGKKYLRLAVTSFLISTPVIWYLVEQWLDSYAYHVSIKGSSFLVAISLLMVVLFVVLYAQVLRIGVSNLVRVLKAD